MTLRWFRHAAPLAGALACLAACGPTDKDVERWRALEGGPDKLAEVVRSPSRRLELRRHAANALGPVERDGRPVGVDLLVDALGALEAAPRTALVDALAVDLADALARPLAPPSDGAPSVGRASWEKDVAYALLSRNLVTTAATQAKLREALIRWLEADPAQRLDDDSQRFGAAALVRLLGADAVRAFPKALDARERPRHAVALVAEVGDPPTKQRAAEILAARLAGTLSPTWREEQREAVRASNTLARIKPTAEQETTQLVRYQEQTVTSLVADMRALGDVRPDLFFGRLIANVGTIPEVPLRTEVVSFLIERASPEQTNVLVQRLGEERGCVAQSEPRRYANQLAKAAPTGEWIPAALAGKALLPKLVALAATAEASGDLKRYRTDPTPIPRGCGGWTCPDGPEGERRAMVATGSLTLHAAAPAGIGRSNGKPSPGAAGPGAVNAADALTDPATVGDWVRTCLSSPR